jgi:glycosyltransferase involved in cell wall biosynthesis
METLVSNIYKGLDRSKFELNVCSLIGREDTYITDEFLKLGCKIFYFDFHNKGTSFKDTLHNVKEVFRFFFFIIRKRFEIVHSHDFFSSMITRSALILGYFPFFYIPKRTFVTLHNLLSWLQPVHNNINRILSNFTDKIICVSQAVKDFSISTDGISDDKYIVIYNGIDTERFRYDYETGKKIREVYGFDAKDFIIGNVATLSVRKGQMLLLEAFKNVKLKFPFIKLAIVGNVRAHEGDVVNDILNFIKENNLEDSVKILKTRPDIEKVMNIFNVYAMPSVTEGFGLSLAEAMASENLILCSDIPPFKEIINDNENGIMFRSGDAEDLEKKMIYILENYDKLNVLKKKARITITEKFSYDKMIEGYNELYLIR